MIDKKFQPRTSTIKNIIVTSVIGFSLIAFAISPRKVTIPAFSKNSSGSETEGVELFNGSPTTVTYKVTCYDKTGTLAFGPNTHTLVSKAKTSHGVTPACSEGYTTYSGGYINGMVSCGWGNSTPYPNSCPTNYHACSFSEVQANAGTDHSQRRAWVTGGFTFTVNADWSTGYASTSSTSYQNWTYSLDSYIPVPVADSNASCYNALNGAGTSQQYCMSNWYSSDYRYQFCCPNAGSERTAHSCDVEIIDPTSSAGYLQSPSFKMNSPF